MLKLGAYIDAAIDDIQYYYDCLDRIKNVKAKINVYENKIAELQNKIDMINSNLNKELNGKFQEMIEFEFENGKPISRIVNKKVEEGRLERLKKFLEEETVDKAINKYLRSVGGNIRGSELLNPQIFYHGKDEFDAYTSFKED